VEKIKQQAQENAAMGLKLCVFKARYGKELLHSKHRYLVDVNAKEFHDVTGVAIVASSCSLIFVEAGEHSIRKLKKFFLQRMKWRAIFEGNGEVQNAEDADEGEGFERICTLLHQGEIRDRKFKKWGGVRDTESDVQAKEVLARVKMDNFWTLAKSSS
jgi:U4/U6 small nuclear ribonucleoprotein PRP3